MRVITGLARGRRLKEPADMSIRPTSDVVKEALFSIIQFDVEGRRVLDLFAGTGQLGIEALSRGAKSVLFVDRDKKAVNLVKKNLELCRMEAKVVQGDALEVLERFEKESFDLILLDPPYEMGLTDKALERIIRFDILSQGGIIICETRSEEKITDLPEPYYIDREYKYGKTKLTLCGKRP